MSTTGTFLFNPAAANLTWVAFSRIGLRREQVLSEHMANAEVESNLLQVEIGNREPNLWRGQTWFRTLTPGQASYIMPNEVIAISTAYMTVTVNNVSTDRVIWPYSTFEYASLSNKTISGPPTAYWYDRQPVPQITFWPVPDTSATYTINLRLFSQLEDATLVNGANLNLPYRFLDVFVAGLAHRLSRMYAPTLEAARKMDYAEAWANAASEDVEELVSMTVAPDFSGFYR